MLKIKKLNVFIGRKNIVHDVSLSMKTGQIAGLIGPNGAGKTTLMKTILGLTKFTGSIKVNGMTVSETRHTALKNVGALIEHPAIYPFMTGRQNLKLYSKDENNMEDIISILKMENYIDNKSKDYSLGMKQKLGIAIGLLNYPELVILDEPMNGLDIESTILIRNIIKDYAQKGTLFLISSHILSELQKIMTDVILINEGKIIVNKPIEAFYKLSGKQFKILVDNTKVANDLLLKNEVKFSTKDGYLIINKKDLYKTQDILYKEGLHFNELSKIEQSFEDLVVQLLENKQGERI